MNTSVGLQTERLFDPWEVEAIRPPPTETIDQWAERVMRLPRKVSSLSGPLSLEMTPYLREPLRAVTNDATEEVVLCTSSQVGKTTFLLIVALYYADVDPWNIIVVLPTLGQSKEFNRERVEAIIRESPLLARHITGRGSQFNVDTIQLNGISITFRGAESASGLSSKPCKIAIADELDKWPKWTGDEAAPTELLGERLKTFHDRKYLKTSTPTTKHGYIWQELKDSTNERYYVPCPHCGRYQVLVFGDGSENAPGIKWPREADANDVDRDRLAWYECEHCHGRIEEKCKRTMVSSGVWAPYGSSDPTNATLGEAVSRKRGFHLWAGYSLWPGASWSKIAAKFLKAKGKPAAMMNFRNSWLAELWEVTVAELKAENVRATQKHYFTGTVPEGSIAVTFGVDVQATGEHTYQYYVVRAWGKDGTSSLVRYGVTNSWRELYTTVHEASYRTPEGSAVTLIRPLVDSGFRTREVYETCHRNGWIASKGDSRSRKHVSMSEIPVAPESDDVIEFCAFNPDYYKTALHRLVRREGQWNLPENVDEEYFAHMVAEQLQWETDKKTGHRKTVWKLRSDGLPNHYFDCEVLCLVAADLAQLEARAGEPNQERSEPPPPPPQTQEQRRPTLSGAIRHFSG